MSDDALIDLARRAGIAVEWIDAADNPQRVKPETLRALLNALGLPANSPAQIVESRKQIANSGKAASPPLITAESDEPILLPTTESHGELQCEDGTRRDISLKWHGSNHRLMPAIEETGYHTLHLGKSSLTIAVAPKRCVTIADLAPSEALWGLSAQLYGLRRKGDGGIGDVGALRILIKEAAQHGADAIALSPTHALFGVDSGRYSPYSPSNRLQLNPLHADLANLFGPDHLTALLAEPDVAHERERLERDSMIDWPRAATFKMRLLRRLFYDFWGYLHDKPNERLAQEFLTFRNTAGDILEDHARFETLYAYQLKSNSKGTNWRNWPAELRDPASAAVEQFARAHPGEVAFHAFLQWLTDRSFAVAQLEARRAGMRIGLISDLAVGMESAGSHAWSRQSDVLVGLNIGAPPDFFNSGGQNWGLTGFSPRALLHRGFEPFIATLRTALRHAGGVRVDHALGLTRLWVIPEGAPASDGAYLTYPFDDLSRLIRLESDRHRAVIIGEDLGTVPAGFRERLSSAGIAGMDILWFARDKDGFIAAQEWRRDAVAMTSTHDLPPIAGWWRGVDVEQRAQSGLLDVDGAEIARLQRVVERKQLVAAFHDAGLAHSISSSTDETAPVVNAAVEFVAATPAPLVLLPLEDALGLEEQPNLPGTIDEHPNWRRRYPIAADEIFEDPSVVARADILNHRSAP